MVQLTATYGQGDSYLALLQRAGVSASDADRASALVAGTIRPVDLPGHPDRHHAWPPQAPGRRGAPRLLDRVAFRARFDLDLTLVRSGGVLIAQPRPIAVDTAAAHSRDRGGQPLSLGPRGRGADRGDQQHLQALDQHLSLDTAIAPGDTFDLVVAYKRSAGQPGSASCCSPGLERDGRAQAQLLRWGSDGQFFEASGMGQQRTGLIMPVVGRITSNFGARRHPILGYTRMHGGVDFGATYGSPIYAVGDATVTYAGWHGGHGNYVKLEHGGGCQRLRAHEPDRCQQHGAVRAGQVIGYVGSTGLSTGPHLHYELYRGGQKVNPLSGALHRRDQVDPTNSPGSRRGWRS